LSVAGGPPKLAGLPAFASATVTVRVPSGIGNQLPGRRGTGQRPEL